MSGQSQDDGSATDQNLDAPLPPTSQEQNVGSDHGYQDGDPEHAEVPTQRGEPRHAGGDDSGGGTSSPLPAAGALDHLERGVGNDGLPDRTGSPEEVELSTQVIELERRQFHSGPLPDPGTLAGYDQVVPGSAARIVHATLDAMEANTEDVRSRTRNERLDSRADRIGFLGSVYGNMLIPVLCIAGGVWAAQTGHESSLFVWLLLGVVSIAPKIITASRRRISGPPPVDENLPSGFPE